MTFRYFFFVILLLIGCAGNTQTTPAKPVHDPPVNYPVNTAIGEAGNDHGFDMAPETTLPVVKAAVNAACNRLIAGLVQPNWESLQANYEVPDWLKKTKFGICMHWGIYAVPAHKSEWYEKHMYGDPGIMKWHETHFGAQDTFGYKDFIPSFTMAAFNADVCADLFVKAGVELVVPAAQHHDNFALWASEVTPYNAVAMGPKKDLIGELCTAVRKRGLKFGVTNHGIENFQFINPPASMLEKMRAEKADLFDPAWLQFYNVADRSDSACRIFLTNWLYRNIELIDKYQPDILWFDNGIDQRYLDPLKLNIAAYYYNRATEWGKTVSINAKKAAYAPKGTNIHTIGAIVDFEKRVPPQIRTGTWDVDLPIGTTWGYTEGMKVSDAASILRTLIDVVSKNGMLLLNLSPKADGTIPEDQQQTLLDIGKWLHINGEAIYGTHSWKYCKDNENSNIHFTVKDNALYVIVTDASELESFRISMLGKKTIHAVPKKISLLGSSESIVFHQSDAALEVILPKNKAAAFAFVLKVDGIDTGPLPWTRSGNPITENSTSNN